MSWQANTAVQRIPVGDPTAKLILTNLANYADPFGGSIFPKVERIAEEAGISERTCRRWMKYLRENDFIQVVKKAVDHSPTHYRLAPWVMGEGEKEGGSPQPPRGDNPAPRKSEPGGHQQQNRGASNDNTGVPATTPRRINTIETPIEIPEEIDIEPDDEPDDAIPETNGTNYSPAYLAFWGQYPAGHGSKKLAFAEWQRLNPNRAKVKEIMEGLAAWKQSKRWKENFIVDAERFIKRAMWENPEAPTVTVGQVDLVMAYNKLMYSRADVYQQEGIWYPKKNATPVTS